MKFISAFHSFCVESINFLFFEHDAESSILYILVLCCKSAKKINIYYSLSFSPFVESVNIRT